MRRSCLRHALAAFLPGVARNAKPGKFPRRSPAALSLMAACWLMSSVSSPAQAVQQVLKARHVPPVTKRLAAISRLDGALRLDLAIGLPLRNREQLTNLLQELSEPSSANFRRYLTADQFASTFGPSQEDYQAVIDFAKSHGLTVKQTHSNRTLLDVSGSVADIEKTFHVHMRVYKHPSEARNFFAPDTEPSLDLATPVLAISGLDNFVKPRPHIHPAGTRVRPLGGGGGGGGGGGSNTGPFEGFDFRNAYAAGLSQDGAGQSVGLFELFGYSDQDILDYEDDAGIFPYVTVQTQLVDGASGDDTDVDYLDDSGYIDYGVEVASDIEMAISMAPGLSSVVVYEGPTPLDEPPLGTNFIQDAITTAQINDVLNCMATNNAARQLSCSYGFDINLSTVQIFQQFAAQGQSFFLASGDAGAYSAVVDEPVDDPYVTVVGGTTLTTTATGAWASETTWLTPASDDGFGDVTPLEASGGGVSAVYAIPSWQQGVSMTANQGSTTMRNVPDVSMVANNITIFWGNDAVGTSIALGAEGTSLAAPLWAGLVALVNQQAAATGQPPIGFANPALYAIGKSANYLSCFHDVTTGSNTNAASPTKYNATAGYDLCTGWGTMIGGNLMQALLAPPLDNLRIMPPFGFTSQGRSGGPFSFTTQTYTLVNTGAASLTWNLANTSSWLTVSAAGGTLNPGAGTTVTVSLNTNANNFLIAHASGNLAFNNLTAGATQNRQFDLYVGNGGFETGGLDDWALVGSTELVYALAADDADVAGTETLPGRPDGLFVHSGLYGAVLGEWASTNLIPVPPAIGSLSQTVPTVPGRQLLVSFWVTSIPDATNSPPTNDFAVSWNGSTLFMQTNLTVSVWTNMQYIVSSTGSSGTLEFVFNNSPGAFGLDDVTVQTVPPPVLSSATMSGGNIAFSWSAFPNVSYQIQSTTNVGSPNWTNIAPPITATGNVMSASEPAGPAPLRFYRVLILPPP